MLILAKENEEWRALLTEWCPRVDFLYTGSLKSGMLSGTSRANYEGHDNDGAWPASRYFFDTALGQGWTQYDTKHDAYYFGVWVNEEQRQVLTYAEGDITVVLCASPEQFQEQLQEMHVHYGAPPPVCVALDLEGNLVEYYSSETAHGRELPTDSEA